jgi:hypothetical protein
MSLRYFSQFLSCSWNVHRDKDLRKELEEKEAKYEMEKQKEREKAGGAPPIGEC